MSIKALERYLLPLRPYLNLDGVTEICINRPEEIFVERDGQFSCEKVMQLTYDFLFTLASLIAEFNHKDFPAPFISGVLPTGERVQWVLHPACEKGKIICAIRKPHLKELMLEDYQANGAFDNVSEISTKATFINIPKTNMAKFIQEAIQGKKNILISGGTGTGKTTFLNACLKCIPLHERLITVEDTREVKVHHPNAVHLLFNEDDQDLSALHLFRACLRLRPDRILLSELRGKEVWPYLRAANSGHPGSLSTVHADSPEGAITQLVFMMQQAGSTSNEEQLRSYIKSIIHVIIQLKRHSDPTKYMQISEIWLTA